MGPLALPEVFCWTRFGTEAGESMDAILVRKEAERRAHAGVFFWGIGNSVGPGLTALLKRDAHPEILFSPIKSRPRRTDVAPAHTLRWRSGETLFGEQFVLPRRVMVTSGLRRIGPPPPHYALVCSSDRPLQLGDAGRLRMQELRNLRSGNPLGSSQVTAVVERVEADATEGLEYVVALRARLVAPYFVRLCAPAQVTTSELTELKAA